MARCTATSEEKTYCTKTTESTLPMISTMCVCCTDGPQYGGGDSFLSCLLQLLLITLAQAKEENGFEGVILEGESLLFVCLSVATRMRKSEMITGKRKKLLMRKLKGAKCSNKSGCTRKSFFSNRLCQK